MVSLVFLQNYTLEILFLRAHLALHELQPSIFLYTIVCTYLNEYQVVVKHAGPEEGHKQNNGNSPGLQLSLFDS